MSKYHESGFTIVELVVTIVLLILILPAVAGMVNSIGFISKKNTDYAAINNLAELKMESIRSTGYNNLADGTYDFTNELPGVLSPPHSGSYTISDQSSSIKKIVITISYTAQGQTKTYDFASFVSKEGLGQ